MAVADCLANQVVSLENRFVLELGCGPGIPSLVAASCGAKVTATDISPVALQLLKDGWKASSERSKEGPTSKGELTGSLSARSFDIFSSSPLPLPAKGSTDSMQPIVVGSAMTYDAVLAKGLAKRLVEACRDFDAWVILGDDETGEREGGRALFLQELERLQVGEGFSKVWTRVQVKNTSLGWQDKPARILHLNPPSSILPVE